MSEKNPSHKDICPNNVGLACIYCEGIKDGRNEIIADVEKIIDKTFIEIERLLEDQLNEDEENFEDNYRAIEILPEVYRGLKEKIKKLYQSPESTEVHDD